ncbi:MAG: hypothetical protein KME07_16985 [Pegethrix bostrychoides GSE-TBD4-15B]|uniref:Uncharacterized protein n=1 Tax=Pegethrix bostrychoides GSE-TBD4-15B TaxID=2839662 RepID=A0A951PCE8_9CYAN|nr:hypothetical protein [Pegethrix bostrychoides GSE-TBD4-15B]
MSYYNRLHPWCVIRCLPKAQTLIVARFRKRGDADNYLNTLRRLMPNGRFELMFDPETEPTAWVADPASRTYSGDIPPAASNYDRL